MKQCFMLMFFIVMHMSVIAADGDNSFVLLCEDRSVYAFQDDVLMDQEEEYIVISSGFKGEIVEDAFMRLDANMNVAIYMNNYERDLYKLLPMSESPTWKFLKSSVWGILYDIERHEPVTAVDDESYLDTSIKHGLVCISDDGSTTESMLNRCEYTYSTVISRPSFEGGILQGSAIADNNVSAVDGKALSHQDLRWILCGRMNGISAYNCPFWPEIDGAYAYNSIVYIIDGKYYSKDNDLVDRMPYLNDKVIVLRTESRKTNQYTGRTITGEYEIVFLPSLDSIDAQFDQGMHNLYANSNSLYLSKKVGKAEYNIYRVAISPEACGQPQKLFSVASKPFAVFSVDEVLEDKQNENALPIQ